MFSADALGELAIDMAQKAGVNVSRMAISKGTERVVSMQTRKPSPDGAYQTTAYEADAGGDIRAVAEDVTINPNDTHDKLWLNVADFGKEIGRIGLPITPDDHQILLNYFPYQPPEKSGRDALPKEYLFPKTLALNTDRTFDNVFAAVKSRSNSYSPRDKMSPQQAGLMMLAFAVHNRFAESGPTPPDPAISQQFESAASDIFHGTGRAKELIRQLTNSSASDYQMGC